MDYAAEEISVRFGKYGREGDDDEGGEWRAEGRLMVAKAIASETFRYRRAGYWPLDVSDVLQAEAVMSQTAILTFGTL